VCVCVCVCVCVTCFIVSFGSRAPRGDKSLSSGHVQKEAAPMCVVIESLGARAG
jgi:hypothetical protein